MDDASEAMDTADPDGASVPMKRPRNRTDDFDASFPDEAAYVCGECGEEIVVPLDVSAGSTQRYVEDCPVCCHPNVITVEIDDDGVPRVSGEME